MTATETTSVTESQRTAEYLQEWLVTRLSTQLGIDLAVIDVRARFSQYGLSSLNTTRLLADLGAVLGRTLSSTLAWEYPTIEDLARHLASGASGQAAPRGAPTNAPHPLEPIAIVGLACRFPRAPSADAFWRLLRDGVDAISEVPRDRWDVDAFYDPDLSAPGKMSTCWGGFLEGVDGFDPQFFGISPREAAQMDPQQRLMLEVSWEALENAGIDPRTLKGSSTGVFFGAMWTDYAKISRSAEAITQHTATGQDLSIISARVSYTLGLEGPSLLVNTACSSSLVSVHLACQSLRSGESCVALAGGVSLILTPETTIAMSKFGGMAPDGRSKTFDARADGYVRGEGAGVVVLKPLSQAIADGSRIYCVIRGSATNNDGYSNGLTAPNPLAQESMLREAYRVAGVPPGEVHYVEAHGTGTFLGDPIEAKALGAILSVDRPVERELRIGSVKTNIGHLEPASGVAGLIKVALSIHHGALPPSLHFSEPNPHIPFEALRLSVQRSLEPWPGEGDRLFAGVSSFGFGGTNCHVVVEGSRSRQAELFALSAETAEGLRAKAREMWTRLMASGPQPPLPELCKRAAAMCGRGLHRLAVTADSTEHLAVRLESFLQGRSHPGVFSEQVGDRRRRIAFVFTGHGSHWVGMGLDLLREEPVFREALRQCDVIMRRYVSWSLLEELTHDEARSRLLEGTAVVQPAIFAIQVGLAALFRSWGIEPGAVVGQSIGEVAAAHVAGILSLDQACRVICQWSRVLQERACGKGAMALVELPCEEAARALAGHEDRLSVAVSSSPRSTALSGDPAALAEIVATLRTRGVNCIPIKIDYAPHSPPMDALRDELLQALEGIATRAGEVPFYSTVTGMLDEGASLDAAYWVRNLREPVLFSQTIQRMLDDGIDIFLDVGPHPLLAHSVEEILSYHHREGAVLVSARRREATRAVLLESLGALFTLDASIRWDGLYPIDSTAVPPAAEEPGGGAFGEAPEAIPTAEALLLSAQSSEGLRALVTSYYLGLLEAASSSPAVAFATGSELRPFPGAPDVAMFASFDATGTAASLIDPLFFVARDKAPVGVARPWASAALRDICYTASVGRSHLSHRLALTTCSKGELVDQLSAFLREEMPPHVVEGQREGTAKPRLVFIFPGQGSQWLGMGQQLLAQEPVFRRALEDCDRAIRGLVGWSLLEELSADEERSRLDRDDVVQPTLFAIEVALAVLWRSWGVEPDAVVGHSMGEVAAAHVAGALSLDDAARIICRRSALLRGVSGQGAMAFVELSREQAEELVADYEGLLSVAVCTSPRSSVLSGEPEALKEVLWFLEREHIFHRRVKIDYASHSPQMDPLLDELRSLLAEIKPSTATIPIYSTVTGELLEGSELTGEYWAHNLRSPVLFSQVVQHLLQGNHSLFLEMSPHPILVAAVEEGMHHADRMGAALPSMRREQEERRTLLDSLTAMFARGYEVDGRRLYPSGGRIVSLPSNPWQRERCWIADAGAEAQRGAARGRAGGHPLLGTSFTVPTQTGARFWEQALSTAFLPYLGDHCVQGEAVLPASALVEMALSAAAEARGAPAFGLEDVTFERMLPVPAEDSRVAQVVITEESSSRPSFQIASQEGSSWLLHASGRVRMEQGPGQPAASRETVASIRLRCPRHVPSAEHYRRMSERGLSYGDRFQGVRESWFGQGELLGRVHLPEQVASQARLYRLHPSLLDAAFQLLVAALDMVKGVGEGHETYVPVALEGLYLHDRPGQEVWAHASLRPLEDPDVISGDVLLLSEDGQPLVEARGLRLRRLTSAARAAEEQHEQWLHSLRWQRAASVPEAPAPGAAAGRWLVLMDEEPTGKALFSLLLARGESCVRCFVGERYERIEPGLYRLDPADPRGIRALIEDAFSEGQPCRGVVYLWSATATATADTTLEELESAQRRGCYGALHVTQALLQKGWRDMPRLWLLTRGTQVVDTESTGLSVSQAPLWGLSRVIALEHPELQCTIIDLSPTPLAEEAQALLQELGSTDGEAQVALRETGRYVARLARGAFERADAEEDERSLPSLPAAGQPFRLEISKPGILEHLLLRATRRRPPERGEVEIAIEAVGLNFRDVLGVMGMLPSVPEVAFHLGAECSGRVVSVGEGVGDLDVGDEVVAAVFGCFGSFVTTTAAFVARRPARLSGEEAAAIPLAFMTAHHALNRKAEVSRGERVLIHSASGGTGLAAIQIARSLGAEVFATAGTEEKRAHLRAQGICHVMDSRSLAFSDEIMRLTNGKGVDVVLNSLAGDAIAKSLEILAPYGRFLEIGVRDIYQNSRIGLLPFRKNLSYFAIDLARMAAERPAQFGALLREAMQLFEKGHLEPPRPLNVFPVSRVQDAFRLMAQAKHIGKIAVSMSDPAARVAPRSNAVERVRADGTYLITGGLGGLGLSVARWLVAEGARHLALVGRSGPSAEAKAALEAMAGAGAAVQVFHADVSLRADVAKVLERIEQGMPSLLGVVHAAGILDDRTILQQDMARFHRVMSPKVQGAWNLHELTMGKPLDFFVLYSSITSMLGAPGQGNYAAGNAFLDALAQHRRRAGLPATSINWGPFSEVGLAAAQANRGERLATQGMESLTPEQGLAALERALERGVVQLGVVPFNVQQWIEFHPSAASSPLWSLLLQEQGRSGPDAHQGSALREALFGAKPAQRLALLERHIIEQLSRVLRMEPTKVGRLATFGSLGLDSLLSLELRNRLESSMSVKLSSGLLFTYPTAASLAEHLLGKLVPADDAGVSRPSRSQEGAAEDAGRRMALDELDEHEAAALLEKKLTAFEEHLR